MADVKLEHLRKEYVGGVVAVRDFCLDVADGEFLILVGPSGCGKSTTLRMIAGLEEITSGELRIDGVRMNDVAPAKRDIAMVFQNYALYPHMSVYDNMAFALRNARMPKGEIDAAVHRAARLLDLEELLGRRPGALSGGQRQRVAMGRAIVRSPKVFLMDEPLSNLDAQLRVQMRAVIARLHAELGATFIYVTHDQTEAMTLGTRIVVMKDGDIQQADAPQAVYARPATTFVASFIGSPQINLLPGKIVASAGADPLELDLGAFRIPLEGRDGEMLREQVGEGGDVTAGIRPEHVRVLLEGEDAAGVAASSCVEATVSLRESFGAASVVHCDAGGLEISAVVPASGPLASIRRGSTLRLAVDAEHLLFFDARTGALIG